jgi:hypothetical protein
MSPSDSSFQEKGGVRFLDAGWAICASLQKGETATAHPFVRRQTAAQPNSTVDSASSF